MINQQSRTSVVWSRNSEDFEIRFLNLHYQKFLLKKAWIQVNIFLAVSQSVSLYSFSFTFFDAGQQQFSGSRASDQFIMSSNKNLTFDKHPKTPYSNESNQTDGTSTPQQSAALSFSSDLFIRSEPKCEADGPVTAISAITKCFPEQNLSTSVELDAKCKNHVKEKKNTPYTAWQVFQWGKVISVVSKNFLYLINQTISENMSDSNNNFHLRWIVISEI